jgi:hypothetical protein
VIGIGEVYRRSDVKKGLEFGSLDKPVPKDMPVTISAEIAFNEWRRRKGCSLAKPRSSEKNAPAASTSLKTKNSYEPFPEIAGSSYLPCARLIAGTKDIMLALKVPNLFFNANQVQLQLQGFHLPSYDASACISRNGES